MQTAALRALSRPEGFDTIDGLAKWMVVVAWHEVQAEWRHQARAEFGEVPDVPGGPDPASVVEGRLVLDAVVDGLASMDDGEREAIASAFDDDRGVPQDARLKMRRYRARQRLSLLVDDR